MGITKTDFMRGTWCPKMLWLDTHKPKEKIIPPEVQARLDKGNEFGDKAMGLLGPYVETTTYKPSGKLDYSAMIEKTRECLQDGTLNICEAAFSYYNNYCAVDILHKVDGGYEIYEIKDSLSVKEQFVKDVGFQRWVLQKCGLKIKACYVVYHGENEQNPFVIEDVTKEAKKHCKNVNDNIWRLNNLKKQAEEPRVEMGEQCHCPYDCWYLDYCKKLQENNQ